MLFEYRTFLFRLELSFIDIKYMTFNAKLSAYSWIALDIWTNIYADFINVGLSRHRHLSRGTEQITNMTLVDNNPPNQFPVE